MSWVLLVAIVLGSIGCVWSLVAMPARWGWNRWVHWIVSAQSLAAADPRFLYLVGMRWEEVNLADVDDADSSLIVQSVADHTCSRYRLVPGTDPADDALIWWQLERTPLLLYTDTTTSPTLFGPDGIAIRLEVLAA